MTHSTETRSRALALLRDQALSIDDVSLETGVARKTLYNWSRAAGLPLRSRAHGSIFTPEVKRLAVELYRKGLTMDQIGARTGASKYAIRQWVRTAGEPLRATHTNARLDTAEVVRLHALHGTGEAARLLGCSRGSVLYHLQRARRLKARAQLA